MCGIVGGIAERNVVPILLEGLRRLDLVEGLDQDSEAIKFGELKELPAKSADYVASAIQLLDLLKLRTVATVEYLVPLLDEMNSILVHFPNIGKDHWSVVEIIGWRDTLLNEKPSLVLPEERLEKLEFDAVRWLNDFRRNLKDL